MKKVYLKISFLTTFTAAFALLLLFSQCAPSDAKVQEELETYVEKELGVYPIKLDQFTQLDSCAALSPKTLRYYYTVAVDKILLDTNLIKSTNTPQLIQTIKIDKGSSFFRKNNVIFQYQYRDHNGNYVCRINITPQDYNK